MTIFARAAHGIRRIIPVAGLVGGATLLATWPLAAQSPTSVLLVHGYNGSARDWELLEYDLHQQPWWLTITRPTVDTHHGISRYASLFGGYIGPSDTTTIVVAHSAGGVAARELDQQIGGRLQGLITVGSPLQGAPGADNLVWGAFDLAGLASTVSYPFELYFGQLGDNDALYYTAGLAVWVPYVAIVAKMLIPMELDPTIGDLRPNGPYMSSLNSATNLARESASFQRLAIVNRSPDAGQLCQVAVPTQWIPCTNLQTALGFDFLVAYDYYLSYWNPNDPVGSMERQLNAYAWRGAGYAILLADDMWCGIIGAYPTSPLGCEADSFIPAHVQSWPNLNPAMQLNGPPHALEPGDTQIRFGIVSTMAGKFVFNHPPPPPPSPLVVTLTGQNSIAPYSQCSWHATATGGTGSYHFAWTVNGVSAGGDEEELVYGSANPPFTITVRATDASGSASASLYVALDPDGWCQ